MAVATATAMEMKSWRATECRPGLRKRPRQPHCGLSHSDPRQTTSRGDFFVHDVRRLKSVSYIDCDTMNGNCVLIQRSVVPRLGNLDHHFTHSMPDLDYGLRAKRAGCSVSVAPGYVGDCVTNSGD